MALATQCPHCHTTFRVAHDQLKLRSGIVRCGQCGQVFNGIQYLLPSAGIQAAENASAAPATGLDGGSGLILPSAINQSTSAPVQTTVEQAETGLPSSADSEFNLDSEPVSATAEPHVGAAAAQPEPEPDEVLDAPDYDALQGLALIHLPQAEQPTQQDAPHPIAAPAPDAALLADQHTDHAEASDTRAEDAPSPTDIWQAAAPAFEEDAEEKTQEEPAFVTAARRQQHKERRYRLLFGAGSAVLALVLLAQAAYALRSTIAAYLPQTKPALLAICQTLGCSIALPAQIDAINIESSELQAQPGTVGALTLALLLRNRSSTAQAWPNIELTLNDGTERAILRRVFTPREFPVSAADIAQGFAANSEKSIRLSFTLTQLKAAGYRVVLFYP